jgi:hypothetical protein
MLKIFIIRKYKNDHVLGDAMGGECSTYGKSEKYLQNFGLKVCREGIPRVTYAYIQE